MIRFHLLLAIAVFAVGLGGAGTYPAVALSINLKVVDPVTGADRLTQLPGQFLDLIATTDQDVNSPYSILVFNGYGAILEGQCTNQGRSCRVPVTQNTPTFNIGYIAYVASSSQNLPPPDIQATSNYVYPSWLNHMKLYVARIPFTNPGVFLSSDSGGAKIFDPYHIEIFNKTTGALVKDCPGTSSGIIECVGSDSTMSDSTYWAVISLFSTDLGALNDLREASYYKCVDSTTLTSPPTCTNCIPEP
jgi:hypothetical protein